MLIVFLAGYLRDKREVLAQGRLKDFGPLLLIWGAAMLVLVQTNDLGSALLQFGIFLAMVYVATGAAGVRRRRARALRRAARPPSTLRRPRPGARDDLAASVDDEPSTAPDGRQALRRTAVVPARAASTRSATGASAARASARARSRPRAAIRSSRSSTPTSSTPRIAQELGLDRRRRAAARLHALRRARDADRAPGRRRLLEAARGGAHLRLRAADVHHRRRRPARDPADGDHPALRLLRRLERGRELRPARGAAARLQPGERTAAGARREPSDPRLALVATRADRRRSSSPRRTGRPGRPATSPTGRTTRSSAWRSSRSSAADHRRRGTAVLARNARAKVGGRTLYFRRYPHERARGARRRILDPGPRAGRPRARRRTTT